MSNPTALERATASFEATYSRTPSLVVRAPGRVNLIGEHTDYNEGFVFPMALPYEIVIVAEPRQDGRVVASSEGFPAAEFALDDPVETDEWHRYVHGTAHILLDEDHTIAGWQGCMASDIPAGASLSSSAALEVASGLAFTAAAGGTIGLDVLARIGQRVENEIMGLPSGIMDQLASATAVDGAVSLIDCRDLSSTPVALPAGVDVIIMDTGTRRELVDSKYADRRAECEAAAKQLGVPALRDATLEQLPALDQGTVRNRARHVISENQRTLDAAAAMRADDAVELGQLMNASHASLRDDFEVSGPALDHIVALAQQIDGCLGARMTGGGFAGAAVALVESTATQDFMSEVSSTFVAPTEQPSTAPVMLYPVRPAAGASILARP